MQINLVLLSRRGLEDLLNTLINERDRLFHDRQNPERVLPEAFRRLVKMYDEQIKKIRAALN